MDLRLRSIAVVCAFVIACGPTKKKGAGGDDDDSGDAGTIPAGHTLESVTITPTNPIIELDLNAMGTQPFAVAANYADGDVEDITGDVTWTVANPAVGSITNSVLQTPSFAASNAIASKLTASYMGIDGLAQVTVVAYRKTGTNQDFFFTLPYQDSAGPQDKPLDFATAIPSLDVFFLMDTTGSMGPEIKNLQAALNATVIPGIAAAVANSAFGVGALEDFPLGGYGTPGTDQPFILKQPIVANNVAAVQAAVNSLTNAAGNPIGDGFDTPEGGLEAIYQVATGEGLNMPSPTNIPANHTGIGGVDFRSGTMPVVVTISDAVSHGVGETTVCNGASVGYVAPVATYAHSRAQTKTALANICARSVGIAPIPDANHLECAGQAYLEDLAKATGARVPPAAWDVGARPAGCAANQCCTSYNATGRATDADGLCPVVYLTSTNGASVSTSIVTGIQMLTRFATFNVPTDREGVATDINGAPLPAGHTTADFLKSIPPKSFVLPPPPPALPNPTFDATTFYNVTPG
ncbi:MAG TPA: hypothetical protein VGO00_15715, partial [Kofleriaceae bacterium]|nr:hypothetical protein [Kofleriaceae bacterium]